MVSMSLTLVMFILFKFSSTKGLYIILNKALQASDEKCFEKKECLNDSFDGYSYCPKIHASLCEISCIIA